MAERKAFAGYIGEKMQKTEEKLSLFGRLPLEKEKEIVKEVFMLSCDVAGNVFFHPLIFNKEETVEKLKLAKRKLEEMGV